MRFILTKQALKMYRKAPDHVKNAFDKQVQLLVSNSHHPSLDAKSYKDTNQARVTLSWRFYYDVSGDCYIVTAITKHPK
jgi:hypothetical protein